MLRPRLALAVLVGGLAATVSPANSSSTRQSGIASVYSASSGPKTANGEHVRSDALTAAHRTLPFGTEVRVTNVGNGRFVVVRINDRSPFVRGRIIDLTLAGAHALGFSGAARVTIEITDLPNGNVSIRATPTVEEMIKATMHESRGFTAAEGYAMNMLNSAQRVSRDMVNKLKVLVPRLRGA